MRYFKSSLPISIICMNLVLVNVQAQSVQILGSNTLNGTINGVVLGGASMLITDKKVNAPFNKNLDDLYALQAGLGLGILFGIGIGVYDVYTGEGKDMIVSGFFNDGNNSSIILLMDTFYGAAGGGLIAMSLSLVSNERLIDATKYGLGLGAFIGFGFGIIDSFIIAERSNEPLTFNYTMPKHAEGLATISFNNDTSLGLINPTLISNFESTNNGVVFAYRPAIELINVRLNF